jgi:hypothetical protein
MIGFEELSDARKTQIIREGEVKYKEKIKKAI